MVYSPSMTDEKLLIDDVSMSDLLKDVPEKVQSGTIVSARVLGTSPDGVLVDIGLKMEGLIPRVEFPDFEKSLPFKPGDSISVLVRRVEGPDHHSKVSWRAAHELNSWDRLFAAYRSGTPVEGTIKRKVKGGYVVDVGVEAFLPGSQVDVRPGRDPEAWVNEVVSVLITEMDRAKPNVVVSRRKLLEKERGVKREQTLATLKAGDVLTGTVSSIAAFGAFVDIGGVEGLLHISDISWHRTDKVEKLLKIGQTIQVKVLKYDPAVTRISLGLKQLMPHPWAGVEQRFPVGSIVKGQVISLTTFGAFVQLEPGVEGLLHVSELSWKERVTKPDEVLKPKDEVTVKVLAVDIAKEKLSLSLKRAGANPWDEIKARYPIGSRIKGPITHLTPFGAFIMLPEGIEGLVHISDLSWAKRAKHPSEVVAVGQVVDVQVMDVKPDAEKIVLSIKHTQPDPFGSFKNGQAVSGAVASVREYDITMTLPGDVEGIVRRQELAQDIDGKDQLPEVGQLVTAKIIRVEPRDRRVELSIRRYEREQERQMVARYASQNQEPLTLGDVLLESESSEEAAE
jgi:small subunit ribosomal protein S1